MAQSIRFPVTGGSVLIDAEDLALIEPYTWHVLRTGPRKAYVVTKPKGRRSDPHPTIYMHRLLLDAQKGQQVDHANGDTLDNRRCNLRLCTSAQNNWNSRSKRGSIYKGITQRPNGRWVATISRDRKHYWLGSFDTPEEAALAYDAAAVRLHGAFARLNFPDTEAA